MSEMIRLTHEGASFGWKLSIGRSDHGFKVDKDFVDRWSTERMLSGTLQR